MKTGGTRVLEPEPGFHFRQLNLLPNLFSSKIYSDLIQSHGFPLSPIKSKDEGPQQSQHGPFKSIFISSNMKIWNLKNTPEGGFKLVQLKISTNFIQKVFFVDIRWLCTSFSLHWAKNNNWLQGDFQWGKINQEHSLTNSKYIFRTRPVLGIHVCKKYQQLPYIMLWYDS